MGAPEVCVNHRVSGWNLTPAREPRRSPLGGYRRPRPLRFQRPGEKEERPPGAIFIYSPFALTGSWTVAPSVWDRQPLRSFVNAAASSRTSGFMKNVLS